VLDEGRRGERDETPKPGDAAMARSTFALVGGRGQAMDGARGEAIERSYATVTLEAPVVGEARIAGPAFVAQAIRLAERLPRPACVIASGETTVRVTGRGRGGRNQEVALSAAGIVGDLGTPAVFMSIGTDGVDGPTDAAGAVIDSTTSARVSTRGLAEARAVLDANDSYPFFAALGDLVQIGPTDTNVGDLQILVLG
jgi:hydroxypyruvate reductase